MYRARRRVVQRLAVEGVRLALLALGLIGCGWGGKVPDGGGKDTGHPAGGDTGKPSGGDSGERPTHTGDSAAHSGESAAHTGDTGPDKPETITLVAEGEPHEYFKHMERTIKGSATIAPDGASLSGTVSYVDYRDGELLCDEDIAIEGLADDGWCPDCDYRFVLDGEVTDHRGTDACLPVPYLSGLPNFYEVAPVLGFAAEEYTLDGYYSFAPYDDVLMLGAGFDHHYYDGTERYVPSPAFLGVMARRGTWWVQNDASMDGDVLTWELDQVDEVVYFYEYADCHLARWSDSTVAYGGTAVYGTLTCDPLEQDGWSVEAEAGDTMRVTLDLAPPAVQDNPQFHVNGPGGCAVVRGWNNFPCTTDTFSDFPLCSSASFAVPVTGTYTVWAYSSGYFCNVGTTFDYKLSIDLR